MHTAGEHETHDDKQRIGGRMITRRIRKVNVRSGERPKRVAFCYETFAVQVCEGKRKRVEMRKPWNEVVFIEGDHPTARLSRSLRVPAAHQRVKEVPACRKQRQR